MKGGGFLYNVSLKSPPLEPFLPRTASLMAASPSSPRRLARTSSCAGGKHALKGLCAHTQHYEAKVQEARASVKEALTAIYAASDLATVDPTRSL